MCQKIVLPNGLKVIVEEVPDARSVSVGVWVGVGSRHETPEVQGISHLIEHMLFKGTGRRSPRDIAAAIEGRGGQLNAFTGKECTCVYAKVLDEDSSVALDILSDMIVDPRLDPGDIEREKGVVAEEINLMEDTPDDLIHELAVRAVWPDHPLGRDILGTCESLRALSRDKVADYFREHYTSDNIAVVAAGHCFADEVIEGVARRFSGLARGRPATVCGEPVMHPGRVIDRRDTEQAHICVVAAGAAAGSSESYPLCLLTTVLGGGSTSRLFQSIREEQGLAYSVYTYESSFTDCGLLTTYAGTSPGNARRVIDAVLGEFSSVVEDGISADELSAAKMEVRGSLILSLESISSRMIRLGKSEMTMGRPIGAEESLNRVSAVTLDEVMAAAGRSLERDRLAMAVISPDGPDAVKGDALNGPDN